MIVHIIARDKFTNGYIKFMSEEYSNLDHVFVTKNGEHEIENVSMCKLYELNSYSDLNDSMYVDLFKKSDKIIISGVWICGKDLIIFLKYNLIYKTYLHFWGGDFYKFRNNCFAPKYVISKYLLRLCCKKAKGLIFLINDDYSAFKDIMHVENDYYIAPMPIYYIEREAGCSHNSTKSILVGNSATETNQHIGAFEVIEHLVDHNVKVICPLSYGDEDYRKFVIEEGYNKFGNKFNPIIDYLDEDDYANLLSSIDVGIFNNNRQQAMGNINMLLSYGKKVFLRKDTSMWSSYCNMNYKIFSFESIYNSNSSEFWYISDDDILNNISISNKINSIDSFKERWNSVLL